MLVWGMKPLPSTMVLLLQLVSKRPLNDLQFLQFLYIEMCKFLIVLVNRNYFIVLFTRTMGEEWLLLSDNVTLQFKLVYSSFSIVTIERIK